MFFVLCQAFCPCIHLQEVFLALLLWKKLPRLTVAVSDLWSLNEYLLTMELCFLFSVCAED